MDISWRTHLLDLSNLLRISFWHTSVAFCYCIDSSGRHWTICTILHNDYLCWVDSESGQREFKSVMRVPLLGRPTSSFSFRTSFIWLIQFSHIPGLPHILREFNVGTASGYTELHGKIMSSRNHMVYLGVTFFFFFSVVIKSHEKPITSSEFILLISVSKGSLGLESLKNIGWHICLLLRKLINNK